MVSPGWSVKFEALYYDLGYPSGSSIVAVANPALVTGSTIARFF
jgi:hypothetical protein